MTMKNLLNHPDFPHGILLVHKPTMISSHDVVRQIRKLFNIRAVGHTGTLDPLATGMLPLVIGEATRFASTLSQQYKRYRASIQCGTQTTTDDALGETLYTSIIPHPSITSIQDHLAHFTGDILQTVPTYSALRHNGKRMYHLARTGQTFTPPTRSAHTSDVDLIHYDQDTGIITCDITVSSGTYIRSIARDLGTSLGCYAHLRALERLWVSPYQHHTTISVEDIHDTVKLSAAWIPLRDTLSIYPTVELSTSQALTLGHGIHLPIQLPIDPYTGWVRVLYQQQLLGLCHYTEHTLTTHRLRSYPIPWIKTVCIQSVIP